MKYITFKLLLFAIAGTLLVPGLILAQGEAITVSNQETTVEFRDKITFTMTATSDTEIVAVSLFYQVVGEVAAQRNEVAITPAKVAEAEFTLDQTLPANYMPPGAELHYWWKVEDAEGNELKTDKENLIYLDNRYDWQTLTNDRLTLYWYRGEDEFGQSLFARANEALDTLEQDIGISLERPIKIFIYGSHKDLLDAISTSAMEWTGGQAFTTFGVVVIGIGPSQLDWGLGAMTHEMSHLVIHQATDNPYRSLPRWLDEGIAVYNENQEELDDDFRELFEQAVKRDELMSLRTLASPFPADPYQANLAYGESGAVVKFIVDTYGPEAMGELLRIFGEGALDDEALKQALGVDTDGLNNAWRISLGLPPLPGTEAELPNETTPEAPAEATPDESERPTPTAPPPPTPAPPASGGGSGLPCQAGLLSLLLLAVVGSKRHQYS